MNAINKFMIKSFIIAAIVTLSAYAMEEERLYEKYANYIFNTQRHYQIKISNNEKVDISQSLTLIKLEIMQGDLSHEERRDLWAKYFNVIKDIDAHIIGIKKIIYQEIYKTNPNFSVIKINFEKLKDQLWAENYANLSVKALFEETQNFIESCNEAVEKKLASALKTGILDIHVVICDENLSVTIDDIAKNNSEVATLKKQIHALDKKIKCMRKSLKRNNKSNIELHDRLEDSIQKFNAPRAMLSTRALLLLKLPTNFQNVVEDFNEQYESIVQAVYIGSPDARQLKKDFELRFAQLIDVMASNIALKLDLGATMADIEDALDLVNQLEVMNNALHANLAMFVKPLLHSNAPLIRNLFYDRIQEFNFNLDILFSDTSSLLNDHKNKYFKKHISALLHRKINELKSIYDELIATKKHTDAMPVLLQLKRFLTLEEISYYIDETFLDDLKLKVFIADKTMLDYLDAQLKVFEKYEQMVADDEEIVKNDIIVLFHSLSIIEQYSETFLLPQNAAQRFDAFLKIFRHLMKRLDDAKVDVDINAIDKVLFEMKLFESLLQRAVSISIAAKGTINIDEVDLLVNTTWKSAELFKRFFINWLCFELDSNFEQELAIGDLYTVDAISAWFISEKNFKSFKPSELKAIEETLEALLDKYSHQIQNAESNYLNQ